MKNAFRTDEKGIRNAVFLSLFALLGLLLTACSSDTGSLTVGDPAPAFTLTSESGEQVSLADFRGRQPVLLYFHMADG